MQKVDGRQGLPKKARYEFPITETKAGRKRYGYYMDLFFKARKAGMICEFKLFRKTRTGNFWVIITLEQDTQNVQQVLWN